MEVTLPSGNKATFRDVLLRGDIRAVRKGMVFITNADGSRRTDGALIDDLTGRVIARMLVSWDYGTRPGDAANDELAQRILDNIPEDDYAGLEMAVAPWVDRIVTVNRGELSFTHDVSGVRVEVGSAEDAARLAAAGGFTPVQSQGKAGQKAIGTSSSASPVPPGLTSPETGLIPQS